MDEGALNASGSAEQAEEVEGLIERLEGDDDVQAVFHTMEPAVG